MDITLGMLIDRAGEFGPQPIRPEYLDKEFRSLRLLPQSEKELRQDVIYITDDFRLEYTEKTLQRYGEAESLCIVYVRKAGAADLRYSCVDLFTETEMSVIMNSMQETLDMIHSWEDKVNMEIIRSGDIQTMLDISEHIFQFPMAVYGPSLKLLAATTNTPTEDPLFLELTDFRMMTEDTVFKLSGLNYFAPGHIAQAVKVYPPDDISAYQKAFLRVEVNGSLRAVLYAPIPSPCLTNAALILLKFLCERLALALAGSTTLEMANRLEYEYLIQDLISEKERDERGIRTRAEYLHLPIESNFVLLRLEIPGEIQIPREYLLMQISSIQPTARAMLYQYEILVLLSSPDKERLISGEAGFIQELRPLLKKNELTCGVSVPFENLMEISQAYQQASSAAMIGRRLTCSHFAKEFSLPPLEVEPYVFRFSRLSSYYAYFQAAQTMDYHSFCAPELLELISHARQAKTNHIKILFTYLMCNCRLTDTAAMLFMHRNNIVYHIRRIEEMMRMDFNNFETRTRLIESFEMLLICDEGSPEA